MLSSRAQPDISHLQRSALAPVLVFLALMAVLSFAKTTQAHDHGHRHSAAAYTQFSSTMQPDESEARDGVPADDEPGHRHSGDPLGDLLTLGHHHLGGAGPGLPPTLWFLAASPRVTQPVVPWSERIFSDSPRDTPFRPPTSDRLIAGRVRSV
jgi:hypothetical protein